MKVRQGLLKYISHDVPEEDRKRHATRRWPAGDELGPHDEVTVLFVLSHDRYPGVAELARKSLAEYPLELVLKALEYKLDPHVIKKLFSLRADNEAVMTMAAGNNWTDDETLKEIALNGPEEAVVILAEDTRRLHRKPFLIDAMFRNPRTPGYLMAELRGIEGDLREGGKDDEYDERAVAPRELIDERSVDEHNIYQLVQRLNMAGKIKLALTGNKAARDILIKDSNKVVSLSVLKNPRITEEEIERLISIRGTPEDMLRQVARNKEWVKNYHVKTGLVNNPKTPLAISIKLLDHLYDADLEKLSKSKNIPSVLASSARRKVESKQKR